MVYVYILFIIMLILLYIVLNRLINLKSRNKSIEEMRNTWEVISKEKHSSNISEWSYQRFSNFFNQPQMKDSNFYEKIEKIYDLIVNGKETDLDLIAEKTGCSFEELLLKIMYLKNKRRIGDLYIDKVDHVIRECDQKDKKLLDKYSPYLYISHLQPREIAQKLPSATASNLDELENKVIEELSYLDDKYLINGINIDKVDKKIIYYTIEKHQKEKNYISLNCDKCGALIDIPHLGKTKCPYCKNIMEDNKKN